MKLLTRQQQDTLLDFVCEQYAVAVRCYKKGNLRINTFAPIQTQAYNAAEAVAGKHGVEILRARLKDIEDMQDHEQGNL